LLSVIDAVQMAQELPGAYKISPFIFLLRAVVYGHCLCKRSRVSIFLFLLLRILPGRRNLWSRPCYFRSVPGL